MTPTQKAQRLLRLLEVTDKAAKAIDSGATVSISVFGLNTPDGNRELAQALLFTEGAAQHTGGGTSWVNAPLDGVGPHVTVFYEDAEPAPVPAPEEDDEIPF